MKNNVIVFLLTIFSTQIAIAQNLNDYTAPTETHTQIEETNISIILPERYDLIPSPYFSGFQIPEDNRTSIITTSLEGPYSAVSQSFSDKQMMSSQGMTIDQKKTVKINGKDALLIDLTKTEKGIMLSKTLLIFGDEKSTTLIVSTALQENNELANDLKKSIESIVVSK